VKDTSYVLGIDLSGPSNVKDTVCLVFQVSGGKLQFVQAIQGAQDEEFYEVAVELAWEGEIVVGLDAPLSYNPGGGDRPGDRALRERIIAAGLHPGSVMTPTMTRMAYLTLRGMAVARLLRSIPDRSPKIVEVHPGATMALRGAPIADVRTYKVDPPARQRLLGWLNSQDLECGDILKNPTDHHIAACAAALSAWKWYQRDAVWVEPASLPHHPFDFAC
jgi:predicted nuclease with RNAse H fold